MASGPGTLPSRSAERLAARRTAGSVGHPVAALQRQARIISRALTGPAERTGVPVARRRAGESGQRGTG
jgi:hypothetical protein